MKLLLYFFPKPGTNPRDVTLLVQWLCYLSVGLFKGMARKYNKPKKFILQPHIQTAILPFSFLSFFFLT